MKPHQSLASIPTVRMCPICDKPEDVANDPDNAFVKVIMPTTPAPELVHRNCQKKMKLAIWQR